MALEQVAQVDAEPLVAVQREHGTALVAVGSREAQAAAASERLALTDGDDLGAEAAQLLLEERLVSRQAADDHARDTRLCESRNLIRGERPARDGDQRLRAALRRVAEALCLAAGQDQRLHPYAVSGSRSGVSGSTSSGETARPIPSYAKPAARTAAGSSRFRPSTISGCRIASRVSSVASSASCSHSVTIPAASAPETASSGVSKRVSPGSSTRAIGSHARTSAPSATSREASTSEGASRVSSVFGLNARPSSATRFPRRRPRCFCSLCTTRRF